MSDKEIVEMVVVLILMPGAHFKEAIEYIAKTEMQPGERDFMELVVKNAGRKKNGTNARKRSDIMES